MRYIVQLQAFDQAVTILAETDDRSEAVTTARQFYLSAILPQSVERRTEDGDLYLAWRDLDDVTEPVLAVYDRGGSDTWAGSRSYDGEPTLIFSIGYTLERGRVVA